MTNSTTPTWTYCADSSLQINSVAISDDGSLCAFGTSNEFGDGHFACYLYDQTGGQVWKKHVTATNAQQGVFWVSISGDGNRVAAGGETAGNSGFLDAFDASTGNRLLHKTTSARINQVSFSKDGQYLAVCYGQTVEVYQYNDHDKDYKSIHTTSLSPYHINSCEISRDGNMIVAAGIEFTKQGGEQRTDNGTTGKIFSFKCDDGHVHPHGTAKTDIGAIRVAIVDSGEYWAASYRDGSCRLFKADNADACEWSFKPDHVSDISLAYAIDVTQTSADKVYVACGANIKSTKHGGLLYMVESKEHHGHWVGSLVWSAPIKRPINPGVSMDVEATYVTATDGKPKDKSSQESPGAFYLFDGSSGTEQWHYDTTLMNWPMMLSRDASAVFGGSDDGSVYYWDLSSS